jgi:hypothetical protein
VNLPASEDGAACLAAVEASMVGGGMAGVWVDTGSALALAAANGVPAELAAALVPAAALGVRLGMNDRREGDA